MDTFERKEIKYLLSPVQYIQFRALAEEHLVPAEYPEARVSSIYYDTPDDLLVNRSITGGTYKEKLRVRSYGDDATSPDSPVFIEIKKKFKGITYKRRVNCTVAAANAFLSGIDYRQAIDTWPLADAAAQACARNRTALQIAGEITWMRDHYEGLRPKMRVSTRRTSFVGADDPDLRVTFDADTRWMPMDAQAAAPLAGNTIGKSLERPLFANGERILEVKCSQAYPLWLVHVLDECGVRPQSVSKYGRAYQARMAEAHASAHVDPGKRHSADRDRVPAHALSRPAFKGIGIAAAIRALIPGSARKPAHAIR